ncbi:MAG TPA: SRPBCC family protein [Terracidiphilus sp.]
MRDGTSLLTRRKAVLGIGVASSSALMGWRAQAQQPAMEEKPATGANAARTSLHQEIELKAEPQRVFDLLLDAKLFAAFTGMPATIDPKPGGAFSTFGGMVEGRNVEILAPKRIVQAWRPASWDPGVYSIVHFELRPGGAGTTVVLDHTGFPEGDFDHLDPGWHQRYWDPMKKYLAS